MDSCELDNQQKVGCIDFQGVTSGLLIKSIPFSYTPTQMADKDFIESELIATENRLFVLAEGDDYELTQQREAQTGNAANGRVLEYGQLPWAFSLKQRRPIAYNIRNAFLTGAGSQTVYAMPFTDKGFLNPNLIDGAYVAKQFTMSKALMESADYTTGEKMLRYGFSEKAPEKNVKFYESFLPTTYDPNDLNQVNKVEIAMVSASATALVLTVNLAGDVANNISTLITANFQKLDGSGVVEAVTSVYSATTGQYTLSGTGLTDGTLQALPVAADVIWYESDATAVDVSS